MNLYSWIRPFLFRLDAETAHHLTLLLLRAAQRGGMMKFLNARPVHAPRTVMGLRFDNAVGLAAGLDKDGVCIDGLAALGFGFIEVGTVTPRAQSGQPRPRLFRLPEAGALINRMGFNNGGVDALVRRIRASRYQGILGVNIGKNADTSLEHAARDYLYCLERVYPVAHYVAVNISSPNTRELRQLQDKAPLDALLSALKDKQQRLADQYRKAVPLVLKIAPDLDDAHIRVIADVLLRHCVDGVIATNTTNARAAVTGLPHADEAGGLSGNPLFEPSTRVIRTLSAALGGAIPIIGAGGIFSAGDARAKRAAGASLVQLYTGLIYQGPALIDQCAQALGNTRDG